MSYFRFEVLHKSKKSRARVGRIHTPHGIIDTPGFVAVGTNGTLKGVDNTVVDSIGLQLMFCNTYHMMLQPGTKVVEKAGGLHSYIKRKNPIITDSGGFQVFSLAYGSVASELKGTGLKKGGGSVLKINEDGVLFRSYRDGNKLLLTPESSIQAQKELGADIIIPFDELPPYHMGKEDLKKSLDRTHRWEIRSLQEHLKNRKNQAIYAVIHGGVEREFREESVKVLTNEPFDGFAVGGSLGKTKEQMYTLLSYTMPALPEDKPNHLLGIGDLESLTQTLPFGIDTFDSSYPTKSARHGVLLTKEGPFYITKGKYSDDFSPVVDGCSCHTCTHFSKGYLNHLFKANELTAYTLASIHNLHFMVEWMKERRELILNNLI